MLQTGSLLAAFKMCRASFIKTLTGQTVHAAVSAEAPSEEFQNKAPGLIIHHTLLSPQTKHTNGVFLCILFVLINHRRSEEQGSGGRAGPAAGAMYLHPTLLAPSCSSRPSYKSPLMTRRRGRRDSRRDGGSFLYLA